MHDPRSAPPDARSILAHRLRSGAHRARHRDRHRRGRAARRRSARASIASCSPSSRSSAPTIVTVSPGPRETARHARSARSRDAAAADRRRRRGARPRVPHARAVVPVVQGNAEVEAPDAGVAPRSYGVGPALRRCVFGFERGRRPFPARRRPARAACARRARRKARARALRRREPARRHDPHRQRALPRGRRDACEGPGPGLRSRRHGLHPDRARARSSSTARACSRSTSSMPRTRPSRRSSLRRDACSSPATAARTSR